MYRPLACRSSTELGGELTSAGSKRSSQRRSAGCAPATPAAAASVAGAQPADRRCELRFDPADVNSPPSSVLERQASGRYNAFQGGGRGVLYTCVGTAVRMRADSAAYYGDLSTLYLIGKIYGEAARAEVAQVIEYDRAYDANRAALGHVLTERAIA